MPFKKKACVFYFRVSYVSCFSSMTVDFKESNSLVLVYCCVHPHPSEWNQREHQVQRPVCERIIIIIHCVSVSIVPRRLGGVITSRRSSPGATGADGAHRRGDATPLLARLRPGLRPLRCVTASYAHGRSTGGEREGDTLRMAQRWWAGAWN